MSEGKTIREIHLGFVELLKVRGGEVVQPRGKPMCITYGYDKTIGLISAGYIFYKKEDGTYDLLQDHLVHAYTGVKLENLGLCDARCWYEAIDDKKIQDANKEQAEKAASRDIMNEKDEKEIIIMETEQGFNVYTDISVREDDCISITGLQKREPNIFTPDLYKAVVYADEHMQSHTDQRIKFVLGEVVGVHKHKEFVHFEDAKAKLGAALAELCININEGQAVISSDGKIEFNDTGLNISLRDLKFVVQEAEAYMTYTKYRGKKS